MRITEVVVTPVRMGLHDKEWRTSTYSESSVDAFVVEVRTDEGITGLGGSPCITPYGDTAEAIHSTLRDLLAPRIIGKDPFAIEPIMSDLYKVARNSHHARCGIDLALHDLKGKALGVPVYELLGGAFRKEVPIIRMVGMKEPVAQAKSAAEMVGQGYKALKLKIGGDPEKDVARVAEVRKAVGDSITLTVDANGAYDVKTAIQVIKRIEQFGVAMAEQPTPYTDLVGIRAVSRAVDMPVMADQLASTAADATQIIREEAADLISIKIHKGGLLPGQKVRAVCEGAGMPYHVGGMATTQAIDAAAAHLAVACPTVDICEAGEFMALYGDIVSGYEVKDGMLRVSEEPGLGISLNREGGLAGRDGAATVRVGS